MLKVARVRMCTIAAITLAFVCCVPALILAQGTGIISGTVTEAKTGKPLPYANVIILGTTMGAMTLEDGKFAIRGVPAGTYTVKAMMMGYKPSEKPDVAIGPGGGVDLTFKLEETIVMKTQEIVVTGERPMVEVTASDQRQSVDQEQVEEMPVDDVIEAISLKSGIVKTGEELHVRGGRSGEVQIQIDGVPVDDPLGGGTVEVGYFGSAGSEIISGGMDAEYGDAQSAIINIATKEGGSVFGGEVRFMTDDFGRADKTYTNYDRISIGFGGPAFVRSLRYYISGDATFTDTETNTIEPREETKITNWLKWRPRLHQSYNVQSKLSFIQKKYKLTGEAIFSRSKFDVYRHNWNIDGHVQKVYYFQRLRQTIPGQEIYTFQGITVVDHGPWVENAQSLNPRPIIVEEVVRDPDTGESHVITYTNFRAVDFGERTVLWDEAILAPDGQTVTGYRSWILFNGFQFPFSEFSNFKEDTSYVYFNSATRTPEVEDENLHLKLSFNHNITSKLLYSIKMSRLQLHTLNTVGGKEPAQFSSAGLPVTLPNGTYLEGGISQAVWYTDPDNAYFITAYDYPYYSENTSIQYLLKSDITSEQFKGHRMKTGLQLIYNDLEQDERVFPAQRRLNTETGIYQQGRNVNRFHNFNTEGAWYAQDKWEYEGMVLNAGLRFEFFSTGNNDKIKIQSSEIDPEVERYKTNWSPRLGFAFPITDRDKFFFHYGRFTQWPSRTYLFRTQDAIGSLGTLGNPNLGPELTISYQAGISHQFTEDIAANFVVFNKDIFGLISSTLVTDDSTGIQSFRFINKTYASSRGLEVSLEKRLTRRLGFEAYYTYSFADGVASDADFGRSAEGLTHLPTDELPLNWDQRHTFNLTLRLRDENRWGATAIYSYGSGLPWTPFDRFARLQDPSWENSMRVESNHKLSVQGRKKFSIYGRELTLYFEGRNLLNDDVLLPGGTRPGVFPGMVVAGMDNGSYLTETGQFGGAYLQDIDDDGLDDFNAVNDPTIWETHRIWRIGFGFEF
ncbi:MAG: TonB-dependent receptor [Candidatus Latescibacteria bacterium]|nr:TonB-dependent receptor [Candidatus Latescibacterota bacterium]NIO27307.1 TonB-dependent receptor [Candidatus Latescibacterota bacterium]NIO54831.1 TonB-dependent receptor [Candidatus Latescibacterota bacterium]NIT00914.1 TonB-dependent receptor [Candidatus Latescibacterota bacterium]NIT37837.1 TonB-dependent receptor [Candidatus Latescibacterota bacterium]